jgi:hypothetical protein
VVSRSIDGKYAEMNNRILTFDTMSRLGRQDWLAIIFVTVIALLFLPIVVHKTVGHGQGDVQVFFRAGWAVWTGYPLYEVTDDHGWSYHYPPTFALLMAPFANPLPGYPQPLWALPYAAAVVAWYVLNFLCLIGALHLWASALERYHSVATGPGFLRGPWLLRFGPLIALLPFVGDGLARGQPSPMLLLLIVAFFALYIENRIISAALVLALAATIKVFPIVFVIIPLLRRDWGSIAWTAVWCGVLLIAVPTICLGPTETLDLYRAMWTDHLSGIITGSMSSRTADEVSPGAYATVSVGSVLARIAAGQAFYSSPLPSWASVAQYLFDAVVVAAVAIFGRGGFWNWRGAQPAAGYPTLVAGAVLLAAMPLMISVAKPNYVTFAVPLMAVFMVETWRRVGQRVVTRGMTGYMVMAWTAMISLEFPWSWIKIVGPITLALLLLGPASLQMIRTVSGGQVSRDPVLAF